METDAIDLFFVLVLVTAWVLAMGFGAFLSWLFFEDGEDK